jgi:chemotaxis protein MotB
LAKRSRERADAPLLRVPPNERVKKLHAPEAQEDDTDSVWLVSYADLLTLLLTFFMMLYASAPKGDDSPRRNLASFVGGIKSIPAQQLAEIIIQATKDDHYLYDVMTRPTVEGVEITFATTVLFDSGKADIRSELLPSLRKIVSVLKTHAPDDQIRVEGHTDDEATRANGPFPSNWELSGARASTVIREFESVGFAPDHLMSIGFGSSRPLAPNRSPANEPIPDNMARNRRVVVVVVKTKA